MTRQILSSREVGRGLRVAVCFPSDPWAIGSVFRDAALHCGATVLPLGLSAGQPSLWSKLVEFRPDIICSSASLLLHWHHSSIKEGRSPLLRVSWVFHAGELLRPSIREACERAWNAQVVNVYGMAEFDSVGCEGVLNRGLVLSPHLDYAIAKEETDRRAGLRKGLKGKLLVRVKNGRRWHDTQDLVEVLERASNREALWPNSWCIDVIGRVDGSLKLPDGSLIGTRHVESLMREFPAIQDAQLHLRHGRADEAATLKVTLAIANDQPSPSDEDVRSTLLKNCLELADSLMHETITLEIEFAEYSDLSRTERGKIRVFVE